KRPMINDLWYKNAVIYCLSVGTYMDSNGNGVGDFKGLVRRLDYLHGLGVTAIWLMPFQVSPHRDDGYDVSDYYGVDPRAESIMQRALWWQTGVIYQIYPRSFQDSNGDGLGDLRGIMQRLPYLVELGVDAIWLSPIFPSPMVDFGYDISDYTDIDPLFGSLDDFDALLQAAHAQGLRVILDLVPNHTSNQHPWFRESRASRQSPKRNWYIWRDPAENGGPPNNWLSEFGGSAWEYDCASGQYYYHAFHAAQPDINWRNPAVRSAIYEAMRFWFRRGVDGFRVDVIWHLIKDDRFRDNPPNPAFRVGEPRHHRLVPLYTVDRPEVHDVIAEMRRVADEFPDRVLIGEIYLPFERLVAYYGRDLAGVHLPFNFSLLSANWHAAA